MMNPGAPRKPNFLTVTSPDKEVCRQNWTCLYSLYSEIRALEIAIPDGQNFHHKVQALAIIKSKYLYTRRKVSVSSVEQSQLVVANSVDAEVTAF